MAPKTIYQLKVTLRDIRPPIWRRIQVDSKITFDELHQIIQTVMGWDNYHLHVFNVNGAVIGDPTWLEEIGESGSVEWLVTLAQYVIREGQKFHYEYDFGDGWEHLLLLEKILPAETGVRYPRCIKGVRACPPEDCGGFWGYANLLDALADEAHSDREELLGWLGDNFDPEAFDLESVNAALRDR